MKRLLLFTLLSLVSLTLFAEGFAVDGIGYQITSSNTVKVFYNNYSGDIVIPENVEWNSIIYSVTSIGDYAFRDCSGLTSVTIPNSVTSIGYDAFRWCSGLTSVTIPNSVTSIGGLAFRGCINLVNLKIGNSVTYIGDEAFDGCNSIEAITLPNQNLTIGEYAFRDCNKITSLTIPPNVTNVHYSAFKGCNSLQYIEIQSDCGIDFSEIETLKKVVIGDKATAVNSCFIDCKNLSKLYLGKGIRSIGEAAFLGCSSLTFVIIPPQCTKIDENAFKDCSNLKYVSIPSGINFIGSYAFNGCKLSFISIPGGRIRHNICSNNNRLKYVILGKNVSEIGQWAFPISSSSSVICLAPAPPTIWAPFANHEQSFYYPNVSCCQLPCVYVLRDYWKNYNENNKWKKTFENIVEIDSTDVEYTLTYLVNGLFYKSFKLKEHEIIVPEYEPLFERFSGWSEIPSTMPNYDVIVYGVSKRNSDEYILTYMVDDAVYKPYILKEGDVITPEPKPTKDGYVFSGWSEIPSTMPACDITVSGSFTKASYIRVISDTIPNEDKYYNLQGQHVLNPQNGIFIKNGKKVFIK